MILQRIFKNIVIVTSGIALLFGLPMPGVCQSEPIPAEEPPRMIEEVIVLGSKSLFDLKLEMYRAEEVLYDLFNSLNMDDDFDVHCYKEAPVGSHIKQRVCKTNFHRNLLAKASQRMMLGEPYVSPAAEIKYMNERLLHDMTVKTLENPEMLEALTRANEAKQALESERKRRCEGRLLFCW